MRSLLNIWQGSECASEWYDNDYKYKEIIFAKIELYKKIYNFSINFNKVTLYYIICGQRIYQKAFLTLLYEYLSLINIFFKRFSPVEKWGVTPHCTSPWTQCTNKRTWDIQRRPRTSSERFKYVQFKFYVQCLGRGQEGGGG